MRTFVQSSLVRLLPALLLAGSCRSLSGDPSPEPIIAAERAALDRWSRGDPYGFVEAATSEYTYFDPSLELRLDGVADMRKFADSVAGKIRIDRYELIQPKVQRHGDIAVLTFNFVSFTKLPQAADTLRLRWNATEVYQWSGQTWKLIHSHWSLAKPSLQAAPS